MSVEDEKVVFHERSRIIRIARISNRAREIVPYVLLFPLRLTQEFNPVAKFVEENLWNKISVSTIDSLMISESTYLEWVYA